MHLPSFPEASHPKIQALSPKSDPDLIILFQRYPEVGEYFAAIFCRYSQVVYSLLAKAPLSPVQTDYLFARTWEFIFNELRSLDLRATQPRLSLQSWLINVAAMMINQTVLPTVEEIQYSLPETSPVLWCYLNQALALIPGNLRLILLLSQTFHWSHTRIAAYLQAEGEAILPEHVQVMVEQAYGSLIDSLPQDIQEIYLIPNLVTN